MDIDVKGCGMTNFRVKTAFPAVVLVSTCVFILVVQTLHSGRPVISGNLGKARAVQLGQNVLDWPGNVSDLNDLVRNRGKEGSSAGSANGPIQININLNLTINDLSKAVELLVSSIKDGIGSAVVKQTNAPQQSVHADNDFTIPNKLLKGDDNTECLLTLFTTWGLSSERRAVHENTLRNWAKFKPVVRPVLLAEDTLGLKQALNAGWDVMPVTVKAPNGLPILKHMFEDVRHKFKSKFYGFANADILFTNTLVNTLTGIAYDKTFRHDTTFITGIRTNILNMTVRETETFDNITKAALQRGKPFTSSAEDYFITGSGYPWTEIPELVVGALAYDNWLVLSARAKRHVVIDGTNTLLAVHQLLTENEVFESHFKASANYNAQLLKGLLFDIDPPYHRGFTECTDLFTDLNEGQVVVKRRDTPDYCRSH